ncbi:thioredoxin family protein [Nevskia sp.]|uniref:thioredoxin family protein n=1 Tax=Nevskia sp. TaxID=1929292 RepID=UPI0025D6CF8F|nr:thioredoxin family protein [Nevskia sp.]
MAQTPSTMLPLGTIAPPFSLPDTVSGATLSLAELKSPQATVVMFICNHCPYVIHLRAGLSQLARDYQPRGVAFIAISSNDVEHYPQDAPDLMRAFAQTSGFGFPYLYDQSQDVARAYQAACTPDFFVFDGALTLAYRGQFDDARPGNGRPVTGAAMRAALDALLAGGVVSEDQVPSVGCNIKWKRA